MSLSHTTFSHTILSYRVSGNGHPVVFLHGFLESSTIWETIHPESLPFQSVLIDLPGHGNSALTDDSEIPSLEFMAEEVLNTLKHLGIFHFSVVGHSMGGYVALILKKLHPGCRKVILLNSTFQEDSIQKKTDRVRVADLAFKAKELLVRKAVPGLFYEPAKHQHLIEALLREALAMRAESIAYASLAMRNRKDFTELVKNSTSDFFWINGIHDPLLSTTRINHLVQETGIRSLVLADCGHMAYEEATQETRQAIIEFLN